MDKAIAIILLLIGLTPVSGHGAAPDDVYVVIYATHDGKTGHAGIAVDKYEVRIYDCSSCPGGVRYDTVKTGELYYFDFWPGDVDYDKSKVFDNVKGLYYRLPESSSERAITPRVLLQKGVPHELRAPCDGLLKIKSSPLQDAKLKAFLDRKMIRNRQFNAVDYNCTDFVEQALEYLLHTNIDADEWMFLTVSATTPNKLYRELIKRRDVIVLKSPGKKINGSFFDERIIKW